MRRTILYISLAAFTFAIGFLTVSPLEELALAVPVALMIFLLLRKIISLKPTLHHLTVAFLTLLIWTPFAAATLQFLPRGGSCVMEFSEEELEDIREERRERAFICVFSEPEEIIDRSFVDDSGVVGEGINAIWMGIVDDKVESKPAPLYPSWVRKERIGGVVAVAVVIDVVTGRVVNARALSGSAVLHWPAVKAAYEARFYPTYICGGGSPKATGILTYHFDPHRIANTSGFQPVMKNLPQR